jgi:hypothetical protein
MDIADRDRLIKLIGMLGSSFDGERANAARMIEKLAQANKMTINEMMAQAYTGQAAPPPPPPPPSPPRDKTKPQAQPAPNFHKTHDASEVILCGLEIADECPLLTPWEVQFAADVSERYDRDYELSEKQIAVAQRILGKVERWRAW